MNIWKKSFLRYVLYIAIIISLCILTGCDKKEEKNHSVGASPTIEDMSNSSSDKDKEEVIGDAIKMSEGIMLRLNHIEGINSSMVFINHEAVLVALELDDGIELSSSLKMEVQKLVYEIYPEVKTIAISDDDYVYESMSKLLRSYKENSPIGELLKDLKEILKSL